MILSNVLVIEGTDRDDCRDKKAPLLDMRREGLLIYLRILLMSYGVV